MEQNQLRGIFGQFASGVTVITCTNADGQPHGATVTAFTAISLEPRLCQITMTRKSKACGYLGNAPFAVNILASDQVDTAMHFAGRPQRTEPRWIDGSTAPLLDGAAATISCVPWREYDGGDHIIFIGEIVDAQSSRQGSASVLPKHFSRSRRYLVDHSLERKSGRPPQRLVRRHHFVHPDSSSARTPNDLRGFAMTTTEIPPTGVDPADSGAPQVNPAADCEANRTKNFATRPMTGDEYISSLQDGREIWLHGDRVKDVTTHPAFRNPIRMTARLYDALHTGEHVDALTVPTDTGNGGVTMPFFRTPTSSADLLKERDAIATWAGSYDLRRGWAVPPDYKASFLGTLHANKELYAPFQDNAERWYRESQEKVLYWNHAIINPPVDRQLPPDEVGDVFMKVEKETDAGLIVSGAKVVATGSGDHELQLHRSLRSADQEEAVRPDLHGTDGRAGCEADLPHLVHRTCCGDGQSVRLSAVESHGRERHHLRLRQGVGSVGKTSSCTATSTGSTHSSLNRASCRASPFRAALAWPSSSTSSPDC